MGSILRPIITKTTRSLRPQRVKTAADCAGFTLVEVAVAALLSLIILIACYSVFKVYFEAETHLEKRMTAVMQLESILSDLQKNYRMASSPGTYFPVVGIASFPPRLDPPAYQVVNPAGRITPLNAQCNGLGFFQQYASGANPLFRQYYTDCVASNNQINWATLPPMHPTSIQGAPGGGIACANNTQRPVIRMNAWQNYNTPAIPPALPPYTQAPSQYIFPATESPAMFAMSLCFQWVQDASGNYTDIVAEGSVLYATNGAWNVSRRTIDLAGPSYLAMYHTQGAIPLLPY
jgi:hypothetical protein